MKLKLKAIPNPLGIYGTGKGGIPAGDYFPASAAFLEPAAADAFMALQKTLGQRVRCSDILRSPESSLLAMQQKAGVQAPGYSMHNFGLAIDISVARMLTDTKMTKAELDEVFEKHGWYCHRKDHAPTGFESWHYNYFGDDPARWLAFSEKSQVTQYAAEAKMVAMFGADFSYTRDAVRDFKAIQASLKQLKLYSGEIDGDWGPRSKQACLAFERTWKLPADGIPDARMLRTLAAVTAETEIVA